MFREKMRACSTMYAGCSAIKAGETDSIFPKRFQYDPTFLVNAEVAINVPKAMLLSLTFLAKASLVNSLSYLCLLSYSSIQRYGYA